MKAIPELDLMTIVTQVLTQKRELGSVQQASGIEEDDFEMTLQNSLVHVQSDL